MPSSDAVATLQAFEALYPKLAQEGTVDAYRLDVDLMPMVLAMRAPRHPDRPGRRRAGPRLLPGEARRRPGGDLGAARLAGRHGRDPRQEVVGEDLRRLRHRLSAHAEGQPVVRRQQDAGWMSDHAHWLPRLITIANKYEPPASVFVEGYILGHVVNGRIHAEIHPFRAEDGGTRSSRFSYSDPPLQQIPKHDKELGAADPPRLPAGARARCWPRPTSSSTNSTG